jgi:prolyl-tRNA editing enzyme YbaK/EbsC (Cys-tRNA(Pro) deacylase)
MSKTTKLPAKLAKYLEKAGINHQILEHRTVYTAIDAANTLKRKMEEIAKSLLIKADKDYYLVLLPASHNLDFDKLTRCLKTQTKKEVKSIKIPGEKIMTEILKIKQGALSAFGTLHKLPVVIDKELTKVKKVILSSGSFNHSVEMAMDDFIKMEKAMVGSFGVKKKIKIFKPKKTKVKVKNIVKNKKVKAKPVKKIKK